MSIKAYARQKFKQTQCNVEQNLPRNFGVPTTLNFGDVADEGVSSEFSRSDHQHGMPASADAFLESYSDFSFYHSELLSNSTTSPHLQGVVTQQGVAVVLGNDEADSTGGHGCIGVSMGIATPSQASAAVAQTCTLGVNWNPDGRHHSVRHFRKFQLRGTVRRLTPSTQRPQNVYIAVGGWNVPQIAGGYAVFDVVDGVGFWGFFDASTVGTWKVRITNNRVHTDIDTGIGLDFDSATGVTNLQNFKILKDSDDLLHFYINDVEVATQEASLLPTALVSGWGIFSIHDPRTLQHTTWCDDILVRQDRNG